MGLSTASLGDDDEVLGDCESDLRPVILRDQRQRHVDAGRYSSRSDEPAVAHENAVNLDFRLFLSPPLADNAGRPAIPYPAPMRKRVGEG
ncbi:hypothetical protein [Erythrobacter sp.]|uniref:hypothetical protein n=1 Tax=Erythrobacter sp. TaxID=1042 RepID=UPI00311F5251